MVLLLPGSRRGELSRHIPVMLEACKVIANRANVRFKMVLPTTQLREIAESLVTEQCGIQLQVGQLHDALGEATVAIASTGTVLLECAYFGVPTVAMYRTSWSTYQIGKRIVQVKYLAMPNILADEPIFPEFIQNDATGYNIASATLNLLDDPVKRDAITKRLLQVIQTLGGPGACQRAAQAIKQVLK